MRLLPVRLLIGAAAMGLRRQIGLFRKPFCGSKGSPSCFALLCPALAYGALGIGKPEFFPGRRHPPFRIDNLSGLLVDHMGGGLVVGSEAPVLHSPLAQQEYHRIQFLTLFRPTVFVTGWFLAVQPALDDPVLLHAFQPHGKKMRRHAGLCLQVVETAASHDHFAKDQERPTVAND